MKKLIYVLILLLTLTGCSNVDSGKENDTNGEKGENITVNEDINDQLLEGYPKDVLPLYKASSLDRMEFTYRDDYGYIIGKDLYSLDYKSNANIDEISDYYISLYTSIDDKDEEWFDKYSMEGNIGDNRVNIDLRENGEFTDVSLTIGLTEEEYVNENPFFKDVPSDLVMVYEMTKLQEYTYRKDYDGEVTYIVTFQSNFNEDTFREYYEGLYKEKTNYKYEITDYNDLISFEDDKYSVRISYDDAYGYNFVNIEISYEY